MGKRKRHWIPPFPLVFAAVFLVVTMVIVGCTAPRPANDSVAGGAQPGHDALVFPLCEDQHGDGWEELLPGSCFDGADIMDTAWGDSFLEGATFVGAAPTTLVSALPIIAT